MTRFDPASVVKPAQAARAEAAAWIARLHGPDRTVADEESFRRWLAADAMHAAAFERMTTLWEAGTRLKSDAMVRLSARMTNSGKAPARSSWRHWAAAAGISALAVAVMLWQLHEDAFTTRVGEQRTLTLGDGTRVTLNTATHLEVRYDKNRRRVELASGEALFEVKAQPGRPFVVTAGARTITALGTSFVVRRDSEALSVILVEGKVAVDRTTVLTPGQRLTVIANRSATIDRPAIEKAVAWRQGVIPMDRMPLGVAVAEMNRYSEVPIVIEGLDRNGILVSGVFKAGDSLEFARALVRSHGLLTVENSDRIVLSKQGTR